MAEAAPDHLDLFFSLPTEADAVRFLMRTLKLHEGDLSGLRAFEYFGAVARRISYETAGWRSPRSWGPIGGS